MQHILRSLIFSLCCSGLPLYGNDDELSISAKRGWQKILDEVQVINLKWERVMTPPSRNGGVDRCFLARQGIFAKKQTEDHCYLKNGTGLYELQMSESRKWQMLSETPSSVIVENQRLDKPSYRTAAAITLFHQTLLALQADREVAFSNWSRASNDVVRVVLTNNSSSEDPRFFDQAELELDSNKNFRLMGFRFSKGIDENKTSGDYSYIYDQDDFTPAKVVSSFERKGLKKEITEIFSEVSYDPLPETEFALEHYSLSSVKSSLAYSRMLVLCVVTLIAGFAAWGIKRSRK